MDGLFAQTLVMSAQLAPIKLNFRPMRELDLAVVAEIEAQVYEFPWGQPLLLECVKANYACWLVEHAEQIVGYGILTVSVGEAHILNLGIAQPWWGNRIGTRLVKRLMDIARWYQAKSIFLEVRPSNQRAIDLYAREGFIEVGLRRGYYPASNGREDAVVMTRELV